MSGRLRVYWLVLQVASIAGGILGARWLWDAISG